ncbi:MAG: metalloregulator ArsR/SmtB family transcription factor, partial [Armatimonadota bacterium]
MQHHIKELSTQESVAIFRALGSSTRARIIELLSEREMNIGELSNALGLTQPSVTKHVQVLEEAGIVVSDYVAAPQGTQKRCRRVFERLLVDLAPRVPESDGFAETELPVGMYNEIDVKPTCGLATREKFIGLVDAPVSFFLPERSHAEILWSAGGWVEYAFPNTLPV